MNKTVQAKDISDWAILEAHAQTRGLHGVSEWATTWDIQDRLKQYPPKVVLAKLTSMNRRKVLIGCSCGCRGDWHLPKEWELR